MQDVSKFIALTGRVQSYVEQQDSGVSNALMPVSCTMYKYDNNIFDCIKYLSVALRGGAGVSVNLDDFKARQPQVDKQYFFYLPEDHPDYADLTDKQKKRLFILNDPNRSKGNYIIIPVNDSMEETVDAFISIEQSWKLFIDVIESGNIPVIDLSRLRPKGIDNGKGLTSSGAISFLTIYEAILNHINKGDLISLMQLCGTMNDVLRRGGAFKNGIVTFSLIYTHPDIIKYLNVPLADIPGSGKKAIRLDKGVLTNKRLMKLITVRVNDKSLFLMKTVLKGDKKDGTFEYFIGEERETLENNKELEELYSQVCLTGDTLVLTRDGHYRIDQLVGKDVEVWDGERYVRINNFQQTGSNQEIYQVTLKDGRTIKATAYHKFILQDGTRKYLHELEIGELLKEHYIKVDGFLSTKSAYLKGFLVAEGTSTAGNPLLYIYEPKYSCLSRLVESANETEIGVVKTGAKTTIAIKEDNENNRCILQGLSVRKHELYNWSSVYKQRLPLEEMLNWEDKHKYEFITGVMDGDGTVNNRLKNGNPCYSITSIHLEWLENFQILLNSVGIKVTISDGTPARVTDFGVNHGGEYATKASYRMVFNTAASQKLGELVTFSRLQNWTKCDPVKSFTKGAYNEIVSIEQVDNSDVYCCGVPTTNAFALSNGILIGQCVEILFKPNATCLLLHINGGQIEKIEDIVPAFREIAYLGCDLWKRWKNEVGGRASQYLSADEDRQIGIGWIGLANMLAHFGVSYKEFIEAGEDSLEYGYTNKSTAHELISAIYDGYQAAAEIGREAGLERMFTIAPTQSCAFRYQDLDGNTVCKQINPPLDRVVRRTSHTVDNLAGLYRYGNKVETMKSFINDNGVDAVQRLWELFQRLMNTTGMAHCMSFDLYREIDEEWLRDFMLRSPLVTTYYQLADKVDQSYLNKSRANTAVSDADTATSDEKVACSIANPGFCAACAE